MTNSTTSGLDNTTTLDGDDLLLVSKKSGSTYLSRNFKYSVIQNAINKVVTDLSPIINSKANQSDLDLTNIQVGLKANQSDLVTTNDLVNTKANQTDLDLTNTQVNLKANQADLIVTNDLVNTKASQVSLDATNETVNQKANTVDVYSKTDLSMTKRIQDANEVQLGAGANVWTDLLVGLPDGRTQRDLNQSLYKLEGALVSSDSVGLVAGSSLDQRNKLQTLLDQGGILRLKAGIYKIKGDASSLAIKSGTTLLAEGAVLDFSECTNTSTGRIRSSNLTTPLVTTSLASDSTLSTTTISVTDSSGIFANDIITLESSEAFSTDTNKSEMVMVSAVEGNTLYLYDRLATTYQASSTQVKKYDLAKNISIDGLRMIGRGSLDDAAGLNDRAILIQGASGVSITNCRIENFDRMGLVFSDCYGIHIKQNIISMPRRKNNTYNYIQYSISLADNIRHGFIADNVILGGKHGIAFTMYRGMGLGINCRLEGNVISTTWHAGIATHMTNRDFDIVSNRLDRCNYGMDIRVPNTRIHGNTIIGAADTYTGIILRGMANDVDIFNNKISGGTFGLTVSTAELVGRFDRIKIRNNKMNTFSNTAINLDAGTGTGAWWGLDISSNDITNATGDYINLRGDFLRPVICGNTLENVATSGGYGVIIAGAKDAKVLRNNFVGCIPVRLEMHDALAPINTVVAHNTWDSAAGVVSAEDGTLVGLSRIGNIRGGGNVVIVDNKTVAYSGGNSAMIASAGADTTLETIDGGGSVGDIVTIYKQGAYAITLKDAVGNLQLGSDCTLANNNDTITLLSTGTQWLEVARSINS